MKNAPQNLATKKDLDNIKKELKAHINDGQKQILKTLAEHGKTLSNHSKTLTDHSEQLSFIYEHGATKDELKNLVTKEELKEVKDIVKRIANKSLDHDDQLRWLKENMFTKKDFEVFMTGQDKMMTILDRLDKERIFADSNIDIHEEKIEKNRVKIKEYGIDIKKIKGVLKLAHS